MVSTLLVDAASYSNLPAGKMELAKAKDDFYPLFSPCISRIFRQGYYQQGGKQINSEPLFQG